MARLKDQVVDALQLEGAEGPGRVDNRELACRRRRPTAEVEGKVTVYARGGGWGPEHWGAQNM